jgi:ABC-type branched-subunit amino acid transport system substrate-binding protein
VQGRSNTTWRRLTSILAASSVMAAGVTVGIETLGSTAAGASAKVLAAACSTPATATAAQNAATTGITPKTVTVGNVSIISGPVPGLFEGAANGVKAYFAYMNSKGGVNGRKLVVKSYDDAFSGSNNQSFTQQAISQDFAMVGNFSLFDNEGCKLLANNPAVPDVSVTLDPGTNALPNDFSAQPLAQGLSLGPLKYLRHKYPKDTTVGTIVSNADTAKAQWEGEKAGLMKAGFKVAYVDEVNPLQSDFTTDIINMRNKGVNALYMTALDWQVAADVMRDAYQQNWHPQLVFSGGPVYADQFIKSAGGAPVVNGTWIGQGQALYLGQDAKNIPAVKTFNTWVKKVAPSWTPDLFTLYGWASAQMFTQALQAAGPHPTRGAVLANLHKITTFNASGLLGTADPASKTPSPCYVMAQIKNGKFVRAYPAKTGLACNASYYYLNGKP